MSSSYPGGIDSFTNPTGTDPLSNPEHALQHANANDAIEAIETELGVNPSGTATTVAARLTDIEATAGGIAANAAAAALSASQSATSASAASTYATNAETSFDNFDDRYLGAKASAPSVDNDGNALITGAMYFNSTQGQMYVRTAAAAWVSLTAAVSTSISANTAAPALQITQTGTGAALLVEDSASPDSTPFVIDASGNVGVGTTSPVANLHVQTDGSTVFRIARASTDANPPTVQSIKYRGTSSSKTIVAAGDNLGATYYYGWDGTTEVAGAGIAAAVDGTPGTNDMPGRLVFSTTADGASTPTERMRITSAGNVGIGVSAPASTLHVNGDSSTTMRLQQNSTDTQGGYLYMVKQRGTEASPTVVSSGDTLGQIQWLGWSGSARSAAASIAAVVDGTPGVGDMPGRLTFATSPDGSIIPTERMRITSAGNVGIGTTSPAYKLDVNGTVNATGTVTAGRFAGHGAVAVCTSSTRPGSPSAGDVIFETDTTLYYGYNGTSWTSIGGGAGGAGGDTVFFENGQTVTTSYSITTNKNAVSAGPITINSGATVTVPSGSTWTVV